jgi:hypothetical protein
MSFLEDNNAPDLNNRQPMAVDSKRNCPKQSGSKSGRQNMMTDLDTQHLLLI